MSKPRFLVLIKVAIGLATFGLFSVAAFLAILWHEHATEISLPYPSGRFAVGRTMDVWADSRRPNEVLVWIWYPSVSPGSAAAAEYLPAWWRLGISHLPSRRSVPATLMDDFLTRDPAVVRTHSTIDPPVSSEQAAFPVVIMRAGGSALTADFTTLAEDLASHGYIVVGFDAPLRSTAVVFPDGRVIERALDYDLDAQPAGAEERLAEKLLIMWTEDTRFVVDQLYRLNDADPSGRFTGRLDLDRLGMGGHSLGGATALEFCHEDSRCKAGINMDGIPFGSVVREGLSQPFLFLIEGGDFPPAGRDRQRNSDADMFFSRITSIYKAQPDKRLMLSVRGTNHFSFGDVILLKSHYIVRALLLLTRGLDVRRGLAITTECVHTFFDVYLKNAPPSLLESLQRSNPEIQKVTP